MTLCGNPCPGSASPGGPIVAASAGASGTRMALRTGVRLPEPQPSSDEYIGGSVNRFTRRLLHVTVVLAASAVGVAGLQSAGFADPGGQPVTRCSGWLQISLWRHKACVTMDPSS